MAIFDLPNNFFKLWTNWTPNNFAYFLFLSEVELQHS